MHNKLEDIIIKTREDLIRRKKQIPLSKLKKLTGKHFNHLNRLFAKAIKNPKNGSIAIIAEIKLSSPSEKYFGSTENIQARAKEYEQAGTDAISVVTEKHFFKGNPAFVRQIKDAVSLPVLQKDFILDQYQLFEAKIAGADSILLIARILSEKDLVCLVGKTKQLGITPIVEIQNIEDLEKAQASKTEIIAVNARDLDNFKVSIDNACKLLHRVPNFYTKLGFSGVSKKVDVEKYKKAGAEGVLIGTSLMKAKNISQSFKEITL
ncbi:indole-3-glycerol phosphate synthase TrpC [Patescibacteria group bacterium]|nr:indole-3-glycerol phosphate synthase TrpC [Patescibacteria group bacterium]